MSKVDGTGVSFARARSRVRRMVAEVEDRDHERGELNLVPYLDILVNTIIFLLATTAIAVPLSQVKVSAPPYVDDESKTPGPAPTPRDPPPLSVGISYSGFVLGSAGGVLAGKSAGGPTVPCAATLKEGRCPAFPVGKVGVAARWVDRYDYDALERLANQIKSRYPKMRRAVITADRRIPYRVVVRTMDALRGRPTTACTGEDGCLFDRVSFGTGVM